MATVLFIIVIIYTILFAFGFLSYIFTSVGLYKLAKKEEEGLSFFAWIPYLNKYILGRIAFGSNTQGIIMTILNIATLLLYISLMFLTRDLYLVYFAVIMSCVLSIVTVIYNYIARYKIYSRYSKSTIIMTVLDILSFGILGPIFIFAIRNNELKEK